MSTERAAPRELPGLIGIIAPIWREVFVAPVQEGRLRAVGWSDGVKLAVALSVAGYLAMMGLVMVSGLVTGLWSGPVAIGVHVLGLVGALGGLGLIVALGLLAAAQLGWLRWPVFLAAGGILVVQVLPALVLAYSGARLRFLVPVLVTVGLSWIALLVAVLRGSGRPVSLRRSYLVFGLVGYAMLVPPLATGFLLWGIGGDHDFTFTPTYYLIIFLVALVLPVAYASGASFVQLTVSAGNWLAVATIEALGRRARVVVPALCGLLLVANVLATLSQPRPASSWLVGGLSAGLAGLISWFFLARARRFATEEPELIVMVEHLGRGALAIGLAMSVWYPMALFGPSGWPRNPITFALSATVSIVLAERSARRGQGAGAAAFGAVAVACLVMFIGTLAPSTGVGLQQRVQAVTAVAILVLLTAIRLWRRTMTAATWLLTAIGLLICLLLPWRETIAEPIPALLGFSTVGVLFFGLLWRVLTEAQWANGHSRGLPRNARVLLFCAYALLTAAATMVLAYSAEGSQRHLDLDGYATIGGNILGAAIPMAVVVVLAEMARPNRSVPRAAYG